MLWQHGSWNHLNVAGPTDSLPNALNPIKLCERLFVSDVVDAACCSAIRDSKRDGRCDVLNVTACPPPSRSSFLQQDDVASVNHAFEKLEQAMLRVARTIDLGQTQDRAGQPIVAKDCLLNQNLLVAVCQVGRLLRRRTIWVQRTPKRRALSKRLCVGWAVLQTAKTTIGAVNIHAAHRHHATRYATKCLRDERRVLFCVRKHV